MNLFIAHHEAVSGGEADRFGSGWENLFTEQLAFFLRADRWAANAVAQLLLGTEQAVVDDISTQFSASDGRPDLRIVLSDGGAILVEHKVGAVLGTEQIERYLNDGRVALVSERSQRVSAAALAAPGYLRPSGRDYFLWSDIYSAISGAKQAPEGFGELREHFRGYMRELGFAPSSLTLEWRRLFEDRTEPENRNVQRAFGRLLTPLDRFARSHGLKTSGVSHKGRALQSVGGAGWRHLVVFPERVRVDYMSAAHAAEFDPGFEGLTVKAVFDEANVEQARALFSDLGEGFVDEAGRTWRPVKPRPTGVKRWAVSLTTPLAPILDRQEEDPLSVSDAAIAGTQEVLRAASVAKIYVRGNSDHRAQ